MQYRYRITKYRETVQELAADVVSDRPLTDAEAENAATAEGKWHHLAAYDIVTEAVDRVQRLPLDFPKFSWPVI